MEPPLNDLAITPQIVTIPSGTTLSADDCSPFSTLPHPMSESLKCYFLEERRVVPGSVATLAEKFGYVVHNVEYGNVQSTYGKIRWAYTGTLYYTQVARTPTSVHCTSAYSGQP